MSKNNVVSLWAPESSAISDPLTELLRRNAKRLEEAAVAGLSSNVVARLKREWWDE